MGGNVSHTSWCQLDLLIDGEVWVSTDFKIEIVYFSWVISHPEWVITYKGWVLKIDLESVVKYKKIRADLDILQNEVGCDNMMSYIYINHK